MNNIIKEILIVLDILTIKKRIFLHLGCKCEFRFKKRKKGTAIAML